MILLESSPLSLVSILGVKPVVRLSCSCMGLTGNIVFLQHVVHMNKRREKFGATRCVFCHIIAGMVVDVLIGAL